MRDILDRAGFEPQRIKTLTTPDETKPTAIIATLRQINPSPGDLVVFYFSGHGDQVRDLNGDEDDGMDEMLAGSSACLLDDDLRPVWVGYGPAVRIVMIVDACHAGSTFSIHDFAVNKDDGRRPAGEAINRTRSRRAERSRSLSAAEKEAQREEKFKRERTFERSRTALNQCVDIRTQRNEPYQMIYIGASRDPSTAIGLPSGGLFTLHMHDLVIADNSGGRNYKQLCLDIPSCQTGGMSYAEIGVVTEAFRNSTFLQIN